MTSREEPFARFDTNAGDIEIEATASPSAPNLDQDEDENRLAHLTGTAVSFKALQKRVSEENPNEAIDIDNDNRRFDNPMYENPDLLVEQQRRLQKSAAAEPNIYAPDPLIFKKCTVKKSNSKQDNLTVENPLYDMMVDIAKEASKETTEITEKAQDETKGKFLKNTFGK